jgi:hypothetical protein
LVVDEADAPDDDREIAMLLTDETVRRIVELIEDHHTPRIALGEGVFDR